MSDPFSTGHADWMPGTAGPASGFFTGIGAGYNEQYEVGSMYGLEDDVYDQWTKSLSALETATGQRYDMPLQHGDINNYIAAVEGKDPSIFYQPITLHGFDPSELIKKREAFQKANDAIKALNNPNILTMEDIVKQVKEHRAQVEQQSALVSQTGGLGAEIGQFVGGVAGSFSTHDPINVITLPFGGFGKTAAVRIATEMGIMGGINAVQQYGAVEPNRDLLGEEPGSPLQSVIMAMVGAGIFRGGAEAIGATVGRYNKGLAERIGEREAAANKSWIDSEKLKEVFETNMQSPSARAGIHILDATNEFDHYNPYGDTEIGARQFMADAEHIRATINGETAGDLPPVDITNLDVDKEVVRTTQPEVVDRLEQAQATVADLDQKIEAAQTNTGDLTVADAIERVNPEQGGIARQLEEQLNTPDLSVEQRSAITQKLDEIVASLGGPKRIADEAKAAAEVPKAELSRLQTARREASKELIRAHQDFNESLKKIHIGQQIKRMTEGPVTSQTQFNPSRNRADVVATRSKEIDGAEKALPETSEAVASGLETEDGKIDLGNGTVVDPEFRFSDPDNPEVEITARALAKKIKDDEALVKAMKECSIV